MDSFFPVRSHSSINIKRSFNSGRLCDAVGKNNQELHNLGYGTISFTLLCDLDKS